MANPQLENGYMKIANEIMDEIYTCKFNGTEFRIIMVIWRYTYGFNRKEHELSTNFIANAVGMDNSRVRKVLKDLINSKVILVKKQATFNKSRVLSFNKNYRDWGVKKDRRGEKQPHYPKTTQPQGSKTTQPQGSKSTPKKYIIKNKYKDNITTTIHARKINNSTGRNKIKMKNAILNRFLELRGTSLHFSPKDESAAEEIEKEGIPLEDAIKYLEDCFADYEKRKKHSRDRINGLDYCVGYIFDRHYRKLEVKNNVTRIHGYRGRDARGFTKGKSYEQAIREAELARKSFNR